MIDLIVGKEFKQNCGDSLLVLNKTEKSGYFLCKFQKYPYEVIKSKTDILKGTCLNPQIEIEEFIKKEWPQNCGDSLRIIKKTDKKKGNAYLWECEFIKYPCKVFVCKGDIIKKQINNPQIERVEFIDKLWPQHCGDILKIVKKIDKRQGNERLFECEFIKYPYKIITTKKGIIEGTVNNPQIEVEEFINKIWHQNCGDDLRIIKKSEEKSGHNFKWLCEFIEYPCQVFAIKKEIKNGVVLNPNMPWLNKEELIKKIKDFSYKPTLQELANYIGKSKSHIGHKVQEFKLQDYIDYTPIESPAEKELREFCYGLNNSTKSKGDWAILKNREIDILIPKLKLGIEYNGNYWHSELFKERNYHQEKSLLAQEKGIQLVHIWEWEWNDINNKIKSLIKSKLGIFDKKVGASKCKIKELDNKEYQNFCNENHLQGECGAKIKLGLFYKGELIQVMSFGVPRFTSNYEWEIIRECSKLGYCIIGGKEKLWSHFLKNWNPKNCISYCDFSKFNGHSYLKLGFKEERLNKPGFWWYDEKLGIIYLRTPTKHNEYKNKFLKLYDCGQLVFIWKNNR